MPKDEADPDDPMELAGAVFEATEAELAEAARCFIEEFAWLGFDRARLLAMFRDPSYRAVHGIWRQKGDAWVAALVDDVAREWAPVALDAERRSTDA